MSNIISDLGGFVCVRNNFRLDYCADLAVQSLLEVCEEVVVCDSDSTDGTTEFFQRWAEIEPRIKLINMPWTNPKGVSHNHWIEWLNYAREHLATPHSVYVDADEILDLRPESIAALREAVEGRKSLRVDRLNFYRDPQHLIPDGECCGKWCVRVGPSEYRSVSDQPIHPGEERIVDEAINEPRIKIFHIGFLRDKDAFYRKARAVLDIWFNRFDSRLEEGEKKGIPVWETECEWIDRIVPYTENYYPEPVKNWLIGRGHTFDCTF